jgi:hypothetical protein
MLRRSAPHRFWSRPAPTPFLLGFTTTVLLLYGAALPQAQNPRLASFALECYVPTTPGYHTRATLIGTFHLAERTVSTVASCHDGPSPSVWPTFDASDGAVTSVDLVVVTVLENAQYHFVAYNYCTATGTNGYLTFHCMADPQQGGEVNVLVSIAP